MSCYQTCETNEQCNTDRGLDGCCSDGYCTSAIVCDGYKIIGDYCNSNDECMTDFCVLNKCEAMKVNQIDEMRWIIILCIVLAFILLAMIGYRCVKMKQPKREKNDYGNIKDQLPQLQSPLPDNYDEATYLVDDSFKRHLKFSKNNALNAAKMSPKENTEIERKFHASKVIQERFSEDEKSCTRTSDESPYN